MTLRLAPAPAMADFLERAAASAGAPAGGDWSEPLHCGIAPFPLNAKLS